MKTNDPQDGFVSIKPRGRQNLISQKNEFKSKFKKPKAFIKPKPSGKKTFHHYNHLEGDRDTKFTSNITGAEWAKYSFAKWSKVIDQKGVVLESQKTPLKSLERGEEVKVIDMRGRIEPQYKIIDGNGDYWFLPVTKLKILN
tara:strand:+ start:878 stop:1303 length:426 start_codon:yes stop_codon:yes gene_type:complete